MKTKKRKTANEDFADHMKAMADQRASGHLEGYAEAELQAQYVRARKAAEELEAWVVGPAGPRGIASTRATMQKTMVKRQALDVLKWLTADPGEPAICPMALASHARSHPGNVRQEVKTMADAYFALHAKAVAVLLG